MFDDKNKVNEFKFKNYLKEFNYEHINSIGPNGFFEKKSQISQNPYGSNIFNLQLVFINL